MIEKFFGGVQSEKNKINEIIEAVNGMGEVGGGNLKCTRIDPENIAPGMSNSGLGLFCECFLLELSPNIYGVLVGFSTYVNENQSEYEELGVANIYLSDYLPSSFRTDDANKYSFGTWYYSNGQSNIKSGYTSIAVIDTDVRVYLGYTNNAEKATISQTATFTGGGIAIFKGRDD